jgi:oligopeptide transport system permease protein
MNMSQAITTPTVSETATAAPAKSLWHDAFKRLKKNRAALYSGVFILILCGVAIFARRLAPYSFDEQNMDLLLSPPSSTHWLGTDDLGRDLLSRLIYGAQMSMAVGIFTSIFSLAMGVVYGAIAGWVGGLTDSIMMRFVDILDSIPTLVLLILVKILFDAVNVFMHPEVRALIGVLMALSIFGWIMLARVVRGQVMQVKQMLYVEAAHALGEKSLPLLFKHVLPNIMGPIVVVLTFQIPSNIMFESFLSFIGLGLQPPYSSWGVLANSGWKTIKTYPHLIVAPGLALFLTMLAFNLLGDGLRDAVDPKTK